MAQVLLEIADEFVENVALNACALAKHRRSTTVEVQDVKLHLGTLLVLLVLLCVCV